MIPLIIHQTWKQEKLPAPLNDYSQTWRRLNPDYEYRFYDDDRCAAFVRDEYPHLAQLYETLPLPILRADLFRYLVVYRFGGVYADVDMECLQPLRRLTSIDGMILSIEARLTSTRQRELGYRYPYQIANCIFASEAGHPFLGSIIKRAVSLLGSQQTVSPLTVEDLTGPRMLTRLFYEITPPNVRVLRQIYWLPYRFYPRVYPLNVNMYACHHFMGSWKEAIGSDKSLRRQWIERDIPPNPFPAGLFHTFDDK